MMNKRYSFQFYLCFNCLTFIMSISALSNYKGRKTKQQEGVYIITRVIRNYGINNIMINVVVKCIFVPFVCFMFSMLLQSFNTKKSKYSTEDKQTCSTSNTAKFPLKEYTFFIIFCSK